MKGAHRALGRTLLTGRRRSRALAALTGWRDVEGRDAIARTFVFRTFAAAFRFMAEVAREAERLNHHPEWTNVYNRVEVTLTTHDSGGVTDYDVALASFMDRMAATDAP